VHIRTGEAQYTQLNIAELVDLIGSDKGVCYSPNGGGAIGDSMSKHLENVRRTCCVARGDYGSLATIADNFSKIVSVVCDLMPHLAKTIPDQLSRRQFRFTTPE
jgi:hypothetical protein